MGPTDIIAMLVIALILVSAIGVGACHAAYINGVIDGAKNQWLPSVEAILSRYEGRSPTPTPQATMTENLRQAVRLSAAQFREYERQHRAKGTLDADVKAETNRNMAIMCEAALASVQPPGEGEVADLRDMLAAAYEQGCIDTHKAIQAEPELALMPVEDAEFGEAADDYAASCNPPPLSRATGGDGQHEQNSIRRASAAVQGAGGAG